MSGGWQPPKYGQVAELFLSPSNDVLWVGVSSPDAADLRVGPAGREASAGAAPAPAPPAASAFNPAYAAGVKPRWGSSSCWAGVAAAPLAAGTAPALTTV